MFIRSQLKAKAKQSIHQNIWIVIGVTLACSLLVGNAFGVNVNFETGEYYFRAGLGSNEVVSLDFINLPLTVGLAGIAYCLILAYGIFIKGPLHVGLARFFLENREAPSNFETLFSMFKSGTYLNVVKILFLRELYSVLWTLLFIFPGIYKTYQYSMIPFILAENPAMDSSEVFAKTKAMTQGIKFDMFILDLSFFGWWMLSFITCGLSVLYVAPYTEATRCELYCFLCETYANPQALNPEDQDVDPALNDLH